MKPQGLRAALLAAGGGVQETFVWNEIAPPPDRDTEMAVAAWDAVNPDGQDCQAVLDIVRSAGSAGTRSAIRSCCRGSIDLAGAEDPWRPASERLGTCVTCSVCAAVWRLERSWATA